MIQAIGKTGPTTAPKVKYQLPLALGLLLLVACRPQPAVLARPAPSGPLFVDLPGEDVPLLPSGHIPTVAAPHLPYNSVPPTSGPHVPQTVAPGVYRQEIPNELQVHALEHGHVLVQYAPALAPARVRLLEGIARRHPRDVVVAPYGQLSDGVALTAWGRLERLERGDVDRIEAFISAFAGRYDHGWRR